MAGHRAHHLRGHPAGRAVATCRNAVAAPLARVESWASAPVAGCGSAAPGVARPDAPADHRPPEFPPASACLAPAAPEPAHRAAAGRCARDPVVDHPAPAEPAAGHPVLSRATDHHEPAEPAAGRPDPGAVPLGSAPPPVVGFRAWAALARCAPVERAVGRPAEPGARHAVAADRVGPDLNEAGDRPGGHRSRPLPSTRDEARVRARSAQTLG